MRCPLTLRKFSNLPKRKIKILGLLLASAPLALVSAEVLIPTATGMSWRFNMIQEVGKGLRVPDFKTDADGKIRRPAFYRIAGIENVDGAAGEFHASRIHGEQTSPSRMTIDRWFVAGTGIVKDVTTMRSAKGDLLERISLELAERPKVVDRPEVKSDGGPKQISVSLSKERFGKAATTFSSDTPQIYARWKGHRLRNGAKVRVDWIAENIGEDAPKDYGADEASTIAEGPTSSGGFVLSRPDDGWVPGDYRAEFYVDDVLVDTVKLKIVK